MNRFQLLNMDESENDSDSDDDTSGVTLQSTFAPSTIAVWYRQICYSQISKYCLPTMLQARVPTWEV